MGDDGDKTRGPKRKSTDVGLDAPPFLQLEEALPSPYLYVENDPSRLSLILESSSSPPPTRDYRSSTGSPRKSRPNSEYNMADRLRLPDSAAFSAGRRQYDAQYLYSQSPARHADEEYLLQPYPPNGDYDALHGAVDTSYHSAHYQGRFSPSGRPERVGTMLHDGPALYPSQIDYHGKAMWTPGQAEEPPSPTFSNRHRPFQNGPGSAPSSPTPGGGKAANKPLAAVPFKDRPKHNAERGCCGVRKRKHRDCVFIFIYWTLVLAAFGGYGYCIWLSRFWSENKGKMLIPGYAHALIALVLICLLVMAIASCARWSKSYRR